MLKFLYNTKNKYLNINNGVKKLEQKIFFLKIWARNVGVHYTWEYVIHSKIQYFFWSLVFRNFIMMCLGLFS